MSQHITGKIQAKSATCQTSKKSKAKKAQTPARPTGHGQFQQNLNRNPWDSRK